MIAPAPIPLKDLIAAYREVHAACAGLCDLLARQIRGLEWHASQSVETSAPAPVLPVVASKPPADVGQSLWSPARNQIVIEQWPLGTGIDEIKALLDALPGRPVPRDRIAIQAAALKVKRPPKVPEAPTTAAAQPEPAIAPPVPPRDLPAPVPASARPPEPQPKLTRTEALLRAARSVAPTAPVLADLEQVRTWAAERGVEFRDWDDLRAVNSRRERLGLAPFARKFLQKGVRG